MLTLKASKFSILSPVRFFFIPILFISFRIFSNEVMAWIPAYAVNTCKNVCISSVPIENGLNFLGLQFWVPTSSGGVKFSKHGADGSDVEYFVDWAHSNGIKVLLCIYNGDNGWDWALARSAFKNKNTLVSNLIEIMNNYNLDGVDIDFEATSSKQSDRAAYQTFIKALYNKLHPVGKILTVDSFHSPCYNAPNMSWWEDWVGYVDHIHSMGYGELYEMNNTVFNDCPDDPSTVGDTYFKFSYHQKFAMDLGYKSSVVSVGFPGESSSWGGQSVTDHVDDIMSMKNPVSVCIWDFQFGGSAYNKSSTWNKLSLVKNYISPDDTIVKDTSGWGENYVEFLKWSNEAEFGISTIDTSSLHTKKEVSGSFSLDAINEKQNIYPWGQLTSGLRGGNISGMDSIIITYKSDIDFSVTLNQSDLISSGAFYRKLVIQSSDWKSIILKFSDFTQPSWVDKKDIKDLNKGEVSSISFMTEVENATSNIWIKAVYLPDFKGFVDVVSDGNLLTQKKNSHASINISNGFIVFSTPGKGNYNIRISDLFGRKIINRSLCTNKKTAVKIGSTKFIPKGIYIARIISEDLVYTLKFTNN